MHKTIFVTEDRGIYSIRASRAHTHMCFFQHGKNAVTPVYILPQGFAGDHRCPVRCPVLTKTVNWLTVTMIMRGFSMLENEKKRAIADRMELRLLEAQAAMATNREHELSNQLEDRYRREQNAAQVVGAPGLQQACEDYLECEAQLELAREELAAVNRKLAAVRRGWT